MIGINDFFGGENVDSVYANYKLIIERLKNQGIVPVVQSTLYVASSDWMRINKKVEELNRLLSEYCAQNAVVFIDLNAVLREDGRLRDEFTYDRIHLSGKGYEQWKNAVMRVLQQNGGKYDE
jgi:lysophospholipase L1-like esterase